MLYSIKIVDFASILYSKIDLNMMVNEMIY